MPQHATVKSLNADNDAERSIADLIDRARTAMGEFAGASQAQLDDAVTALAWSLYKPETAKELAEYAVEVTGLGNVESKITKNQRKTFGTLRDLMRVKSTGIIEEIPEKGLVKYAKPVGVVAAVTPSTNPSATPVNKAMMAVKGGNAIIIAPSPLAWPVTNATVEAMRTELKKIGAPEDLVQILPDPVTRDATNALMRAADLVIVTGSQNNVRNAYSSGKPAIGVGAGNVPVIIDADADLDDAAAKICASKIFDNSTSCSSENSVIIVDEIYDEAIAALTRAGGYLASADEGRRIVDLLWQGGKLNRKIIAKDASVLAEAFGLSGDAAAAKFFMVEETGIGPDYPLSDEKLSLVLTVYRAKNFADAKRIGTEVLEHVGKGHSIGIHTKTVDHARELAEDLEVVRVLVNQAHTFGNGGGFDSGLPFTLSMGCGTWQGNSISENLNYRNFLNITHLVTTIPEDKPREEELFGSYWERFGK
ncbi:MAG: aldehyde dehydrogenase family protein [Hyphomicrobiaceae bacterium]|nr:aldehyde dehydrogenase family protein [Hyphomicrobiaceae bacterium]